MHKPLTKIINAIKSKPPYEWPNTWPGEEMRRHYREQDCDGRPVEHLITFQEFQEKYLEHYIGTCHDFTNFGFLYDEVGVYGFDDCPVGFKTKADQEQYAKWRELHPGKKYKSRDCMRSDGVKNLPY